MLNSMLEFRPQSPMRFLLPFSRTFLLNPLLFPAPHLQRLFIPLSSQSLFPISSSCYKLNFLFHFHLYIPNTDMISHPVIIVIISPAPPPPPPSHLSLLLSLTHTVTYNIFTVIQLFYFITTYT